MFPVVFGVLVYGAWQAMTKRDSMLPIGENIMEIAEIERFWKMLR